MNLPRSISIKTLISYDMEDHLGVETFLGNFVGLHLGWPFSFQCPGKYYNATQTCVYGISNRSSVLPVGQPIISVSLIFLSPKLRNIVATAKVLVTHAIQ